MIRACCGSDFLVVTPGIRPAGARAGDQARLATPAAALDAGADYLVANTLAMVNGSEAGAYLLSQHGAEWVPRASLAGRMVRLVMEHRR